MKFDIWRFFGNLSRKFKFYSKYMARITGTLHENVRKFLIISHSVLRMGNVSGKNYRENQNTFFVQYDFRNAPSSILFDLVLEAIIRKLNITRHIGTKSTQTFAYADDVAILSRNKNALKDALGNTESAARERGLIINENKTKYMEVTRTVVNGNHLQCRENEFEHVKELSYLGSQLNQINSTNCEITSKNYQRK